MLCYKRPCKNRVFRTIHKYTPKQCFFFAKETRNIEGGGGGGEREKNVDKCLTTSRAFFKKYETSTKFLAAFHENAA